MLNFYDMSAKMESLATSRFYGKVVAAAGGLAALYTYPAGLYYARHSEVREAVCYFEASAVNMALVIGGTAVNMWAASRTRSWGNELEDVFDDIVDANDLKELETLFDTIEDSE